MINDEQVHFAARIVLASAATLVLCLFGAVLVLTALPVLAAAALSGLAASLRTPPIVLPPPRLAAAH
ncbi:MAG TPA: hypothetical protein VF613_16650 [Longimicrobium sp.]|jgi:hypothetical protein